MTTRLIELEVGLWNRCCCLRLDSKNHGTAPRRIDATKPKSTTKLVAKKRGNTRKNGLSCGHGLSGHTRLTTRRRQKDGDRTERTTFLYCRWNWLESIGGACGTFSIFFTTLTFRENCQQQKEVLESRRDRSNRHCGKNIGKMEHFCSSISRKVVSQILKICLEIKLKPFVVVQSASMLRIISFTIA